MISRYIYGNCKTSHDETLKAVLTQLEGKGLTLNYNKCEFNTVTISFYGHIFSNDCLSPDPAKISAITTTVVLLIKLMKVKVYLA